MTIQLSDLARQDLEEIRGYTIQAWGREQWLKYYRGIIKIFEQITEDPSSGQDRSLFMPGMRSITYEKHFIFFAPIKAAGGAPVILRIVHQRRDLPALLYDKDLDSGTD